MAEERAPFSVLTLIRDVITCACCSNHGSRVKSEVEESPASRPKSACKKTQVAPKMDHMEDATASHSESISPKVKSCRWRVVPGG